MKISDMTALVLGRSRRNLTFVKATTDDGYEGVSEVRINNRTEALLGYLESSKKRYVLGTDPFNIEDLV